MDTQNKAEDQKTRDAHELVQLFATIDDPVLRREIIGKVKAMVEGKTKPSR